MSSLGYSVQDDLEEPGLPTHLENSNATLAIIDRDIASIVLPPSSYDSMNMFNDPDVGPLPPKEPFIKSSVPPFRNKSSAKKEESPADKEKPRRSEEEKRKKTIMISILSPTYEEIQEKIDSHLTSDKDKKIQLFEILASQLSPHVGEYLERVLEKIPISVLDYCLKKATSKQGISEGHILGVIKGADLTSTHYLANSGVKMMEEVSLQTTSLKSMIDQMRTMYTQLTPDLTLLREQFNETSKTGAALQADLRDLSKKIQDPLTTLGGGKHTPSMPSLPARRNLTRTFPDFTLQIEGGVIKDIYTKSKSSSNIRVMDFYKKYLPVSEHLKYLIDTDPTTLAELVLEEKARNPRPMIETLEDISLAILAKKN